MGLNLKIVSPEKVVFDGAVERVVVPGSLGSFEILTNHAPIISALQKRDIHVRKRSREPGKPQFTGLLSSHFLPKIRY